MKAFKRQLPHKLETPTGYSLKVKANKNRLNVEKGTAESPPLLILALGKGEKTSLSPKRNYYLTD